jgi:hypothetical protein
MYVFSVHLFPETFLSLIRIERGMIINVYWSSCKVFLSDFNETWISASVFRKILQRKISRKSVQWELSFSMRADRRTGIQTDRQTSMTKMIVALCNLANSPKNQDTIALSCSNLIPKCYWNQRKRVTLYWAILVDVPFLRVFVNEVLHMCDLWYGALFCSHLETFGLWTEGTWCHLQHSFQVHQLHTNPFHLLRLAYLQKRLLYQGLLFSVNLSPCGAPLY